MNKTDELLRTAAIEGGATRVDRAEDKRRHILGSYARQLLHAIQLRQQHRQRKGDGGVGQR